MKVEEIYCYISRSSPGNLKLFILQGGKNEKIF